MKLLVADIAAVVEGLKQAGVKEIYVIDGHDGGNNFLPEFMVPAVRYITGYLRGRLCWGLDESFAGVILLGYHAMNGTADGVLHHTQSSLAEARYFYHGVEWSGTGRNLPVGGGGWPFHCAGHSGDR